MGRAEKFFPKKDDLVHTTELKTQKKRNPSRPIQRLHPLEASNHSSNTERYGEPHGGESKKKVKECTGEKRLSRRSRKESRCYSPTALKRGEDVQARARSGRVIRAPEGLDI